MIYVHTKTHNRRLHMNTNTVYEIVIGAIAEDGVSEEYAKK